jgi:hypothetical protein
MNHLGFIKISRKLFRDAVWIEPREFSRFEAWLDCIQMAQWKPGKVEGEPLARGEFLASIRGLARRWQWTEKRVRVFATGAQQRAQLKARRETQHGTVYLVVNYDAYQGASNEKGTPEGTATDTATEPRKEEEQNKNNYIGTDETFEQAKRRALSAWQARVAEKVDPAAMLAGVQRYAAFCQAERKIGTPYVQQAATFFGPARPFEEQWETTRAASGPALSAAGNPILTISEFREQKRRDFEEINRLRVARGEAPLVVA